MNQLFQISLLITYLISMFLVGLGIIRKLFVQLPIIFISIGAWLLGTAIGVPVTYLFSCLFAHTNEPIVWGVLVTTIIGLVSFMLLRHKKYSSEKERTELKPFLVSDILLVLFSLVFSWWIMMKTFHGDATGQLFVGSNNVFDFSHVLGIIRSFSSGDNIPFMSPFQAGLPYFYHFFFAFYVAVWEYFKVPIVWAMNIPSVFAFTSLLVVIYYIPQRLFNQSKLVGWIAVLFTITNSTLTWWQLLVQKGLSISTLRSLWILPTYPFAGPFDGSTISIFMTLNNYVNQRHLAFAIAVALLLVMVLVEQINQKSLTSKRILIYGVLFGLLGMWNIAITMIVCISVVLLLLFTKRWKQSLLFGIAVAVVVLFWFGRYLFMYKDLLVLGSTIVVPSVSNGNAWNALQYFSLNLGMLPFIVLIGYFAVNKKNRIYGLPFLLLGIALCTLSVVEKRGFDQKFLSFLIIWVNVFAAIGIGWFWQKRSLILKFLAVGLFVLLTVSGVIDLIPIKNEFAYPLVDSTMLPVISWIQKNTAKDAVFVSYSDMVDPVAFAGRKNYFGFFGNIGWIDRSTDVRSIYAGDINTAKAIGVSYVLVLKWSKNDFPYSVDTQYFKEHAQLVYEDERYSIYSAVIK